jgi:formylglycine-generating enzyme required for sulfatase activity
MGRDPSNADAYDKKGIKLEGDAVLNNPVNDVNWYDALVYCNKFSIKENLTPCYSIDGSTIPDDWGEVPTSSNSTWNAATCDFNANGYRLPTNAEWEWLARGGKNYEYAGSDNLDNVAWYTENTNRTGTREVKTKAPNGYGLYDMSGNIAEWCWDRMGSISSSTAADGPTSESGFGRILRGGSWFEDGLSSPVACSTGILTPYKRDYFCGFRVVRTAK